MIKIAICDDEKQMLCDLKNRVSNYMNAASQPYTIDLFLSAVSFFNCRDTYDIIFLDIQMEKINGMKAARIIRKKNKECAIIFVTVLKQYVYEAFEVEASNYLLKPVSDQKLKKTLDRTLKKLEEAKASCLTIWQGQACRRIKFSGILYCEVIKRKIFVHLMDEVVDYYDTMEHLESLLPPSFFRCHRSYFIHLKYISSYENYTAILENGERIPVSKLRKQDFLKAVSEELKTDMRAL